MVASVILQTYLADSPSFESGGSERNVRSVEKIENLNLVAHIYLYLFIEIFK